MNNFRKYKIIVKGKKPACYAFAGALPCAEKKDWKVISESSEDYVLYICGDCICDINNAGNAWDSNDPILLSDDIGAAFKDGQDKFLNVGIQGCSKALGVEIWCNSFIWNGARGQSYSHYRLGVPSFDECPAEIKFDLAESCITEKTSDAVPVIYKPGEEPASIKPKLDRVLEKLNQAYPDKIVVSFNSLHKKLAENTRNIARTLGYENADDFLNAYGFTRSSTGGRPKSDLRKIIDTLKERYPNGTEFTKIDELFRANPEFLPKLKSLKNSSYELFGMSFGKYLISVGLLKISPKVNAPIIERRSPDYDLCTLNIPGMKQPFFALKTTARIREKDYVKVRIGFSDIEVIGFVDAVEPFNEEQSAFSAEELPVVKDISSSSLFHNDMLRNIMHVNATGTAGELLSRFGFTEFDTASSSKTLAFPDNCTVTAMCCRGLAIEIMKAADYLVKSEPYIYSYDDVVFVERGIAEILVFGSDANKILTQYPNLKATMFVENQCDKTIAAAYSKSGYAGITDRYTIENYDPLDKTRWSLTHSPSEKSFLLNNGNKCYSFKHIDDWLAINYVFTMNGVSFKMEGAEI